MFPVISFIDGNATTRCVFLAHYLQLTEKSLISERGLIFAHSVESCKFFEVMLNLRARVSLSSLEK